MRQPHGPTLSNGGTLTLNTLLKTKSLRFWIALGMMLTLVPLAASAVGGYLLLSRGVIADFHDVAFRQRAQVIPAQHLRGLMWDTLAPVDEFVDGAGGTGPQTYRALRESIEAGFADLGEALRGDRAAQTLAERARDDWTAADRHATELISVTLPPGDPRAAETMQRFHGEVTAATDKLAAVYGQLAGDIQADHDDALLFYERSIWLAGIAAAVSLLMAVCGVYIIGRIMSGSVDRLVAGAARFAEGDRDHRIEVQVPPELHRVAEEFNRMIGRVHESEAMLADLAHRDSLTRLMNRRAFDEGLAEVFARSMRFGEQSALLALDIDHFKRVNDTYGHAVGDDVLRAVAAVILQQLRPFDRAFRTGGEEFAVILPATGPADAAQAAERLRQAIESNSIHAKGTEIAATVSVGVAAASDVGNESALIEAADAALYQAKLGGRNRVVVGGNSGRRDRSAA